MANKLTSNMSTYIAAISAIITVAAVIITGIHSSSSVKADIPWSSKLVIEASGVFSSGVGDNVYLIDGPEGKFLYIDGHECIGLVQIK